MKRFQAFVEIIPEGSGYVNEHRHKETTYCVPMITHDYLGDMLSTVGRGGEIE